MSFWRQQPNRPSPPSVARLVAATAEDGATLRRAHLDHDHRRRNGRGGDGQVGALQKRETDYEALAWRDEQSNDDPTTRHVLSRQPCQNWWARARSCQRTRGVLIGQFTPHIAAMLDEFGFGGPVWRGVMMTFDGLRPLAWSSFGTRIQPLMRCRETQVLAGLMASGHDSRAGSQPPRLRWARAAPGRRGSVSWLQVLAVGDHPGGAVRATDDAVLRGELLRLRPGGHLPGVHPGQLSRAAHHARDATDLCQLTRIRSDRFGAITLFLGFNLAHFLVFSRA